MELDPLQILNEELADRQATTQGERRAARWLVDAIRRQTGQVWLEPFRSFRSARPAWALPLSLSLAGGILRWPSPGLGLCLSLLGALGFAAQALGWVELGWLFAVGGSQNVVGLITARDEVRERVVVVAHYDTGHQLWSWTVFLAAGLAVMSLPLVAMVAAMLPAPLWDGLLLIPLVVVATGLLALLRPDRRDGNTAGVAAALAVSRGEALQHTEIWTLFTGSRVPGLLGLKAFLRRHGRLLEGAHFIVLEQEEGLGATPWQRRGEAAVIAERGHRAVALLTVHLQDIDGAAARVRAMAEAIDRALREEGA